jgi:hypothetical protein
VIVNFPLRRLCYAAALAALGFAPARAADDYHVLGHSGAWEIGTGTDDQGNKYCSLQNPLDNEGRGMVLLIYPLGDDPSFELHLYKNGWKIPASADIQTKFTFSDGGSWDADGGAARDGGPVVDYEIDFSDMEDFLDDFAQSSSLKITFTHGTEPAWNTGLSGTSQATTALLACTKALLDKAGQGAPTEPFGPPDNSAPPPDESTPAPGTQNI